MNFHFCNIGQEEVVIVNSVFVILFFWLGRIHFEMAESAPARLPKPQLRGLLNSAIKRNLIVAISLALVSGGAFKVMFCDARKARYANFYKNYDPEEDFRNMVKSGADFQDRKSVV